MENVKSCIYKLYELRDEMTEAIKNTDNVVGQQVELADIVEKAKNKVNDFSDFINGLRDSLKDYDDQREKLVKRRDLITSLISMYEKERGEGNSNTDVIVTMLLLALGVCEENQDEVKGEAE